MWAKLAIACVLASALCSLAQMAPQSQQDQSAGPQANQAPPRSQPNAPARRPGDSSSRDSDEIASPQERDDSVTELHSWDPHKAQKNVEVGDFYFKQQNYRAALSRYCEALSYKPSDAVATFRVAESLEKSGDLGGARTYYEAYLKVLPAGPFAAKSKKALDRIKAQAVFPNKGLAQQAGCEPLGRTAKFRPERLDPDRPVLTRNPASPASGSSR